MDFPDFPDNPDFPDFLTGGIVGLLSTLFRREAEKSCLRMYASFL